jgi:hypothetical protein
MKTTIKDLKLGDFVEESNGKIIQILRNNQLVFHKNFINNDLVAIWKREGNVITRFELK